MLCDHVPSREYIASAEHDAGQEPRRRGQIRANYLQPNVVSRLGRRRRDAEDAGSVQAVNVWYVGCFNIMVALAGDDTLLC